jgi:hypothetical protein
MTDLMVAKIKTAGRYVTADSTPVIVGLQMSGLIGEAV